MNMVTVLLGSLLLGPISTAGGEAVELSQTPHTITAREGDAAQISCCWRGNFIRARVIWTKTEQGVNGSKLLNNLIYNSTFHKDIHHHENYEFRLTRNCSILTISKVTIKNSGLYLCDITVEIPALKQASGTETEVQVQAKGHNTADPAHVGVLLPVAAAVALCLSAAFCHWRRKNAKPLCFRTDRPEQAGMVIREASHGSLEEMEEMHEVEDYSSSSSRGSTEWRPVQVYESVDYFTVRNNAEEETAQ